MPFQPDPTGALTRHIATFARRTTWQDIPDRVRHEAKRSLLNAIATAFAGSHEPAIDKSLAVLAPHSGAATCTIIGRTERADLLLAAYVNAMSANIFDYDDTHPPTIIHPTAPVSPALFAYAQANGCSGQDLLRAFIIGGEIECRLGNAVSPYHYARGWHITSTCGVFGSAIAIGILAGLDERRFIWAIGNAAAQAAGMVETLGTMSKSISVGNAARGGIIAALLAAHDFDGPTAPLEGTHGFLPVYADEPRMSALTDELGERWEIANNTYKPYPVGVVLNPVLEACLDLHARFSLKPEDVASIELTGHPLLRQRADRPDVSTGRESQVSAQHAIAIALRRGRAGLAEFDDSAVAETARDGIRPAITFRDDATCDIESARIVVHTRAGSTHAIDIKDTRGGANNPLSDADIEAKLAELARYGRFGRDTTAIAEAIWHLDTAARAGDVMQLCTPEDN